MPRFRDETIHIYELQVEAIVGIHPHEREAPQPLVISAEIPGDFAAAAASDAIDAALDYSACAAAIREFVTESRCQLLETLIRGLAAHLLERFSLERVTLHIRKPRAIPKSAGAGVSLTALRDGMAE